MSRKDQEFHIQTHLQALRIADTQQKALHMKNKLDAFQKAEEKRLKKLHQKIKDLHQLTD